ncbi:voltage-dependent T-type calcium channel subunit alpha-1G-like [Schistocerca americana]|uniref:voltage-dependent T-type calcium channel subunit alpha-1G-like n=1 Tax=Schistocerca americana TaxID=7009 RepID=UPI001F4F65D9|nr:voltage-dependent T-type calcium channel subunit alpha-1G-like [Schistocerca americana]
MALSQQQVLQLRGDEPSDSESDVAELSDLEDDAGLPPGATSSDENDDDDDDDEEEEEEELPYPGFVPIALRYLDQHTRPRSWCLRMITNPYPLELSTHDCYLKQSRD